jgi:chaperonin cofactor prefoldin
MESALKVYGQSWRDPEKIYRERRFSIRQHLPTMPAIQLQNCINNLNEDLETLKAEIKECREAINQLKHGKKSENMLRKFGIHQSISETTENITAKFKAEIEWRKKVAKWILRERAIYLWEQRLRKAKALKLPLLKHQQKTLKQKVHMLIKQMVKCTEELQRLYSNYQKTTSQYHNNTQQINLLNFNGSSDTESESLTSPPNLNHTIQKLNEAFKSIQIA